MMFFFFEQKTAYELRISDWSSDGCSSDLPWQSVGGGFFWGAEQSTRAWAGYGQATLRLNSGTSVTGGLRWTTEKLKMWSVNLGVPANAFSDSFSKDKLTWRLALDQKFSAGVMGYVSYNRGYKSGGFNLLDEIGRAHV